MYEAGRLPEGVEHPLALAVRITALRRMNAAPNYDAGTPLPPDELGEWDEDLAELFEARLASEAVEASDNELSPEGEAPA